MSLPPSSGSPRRFGGLRQVLLTILARLRFVAILGIIGVVLVEWDTLRAYYDKWSRPAAAADVADHEYEYYCPMHPFIVRSDPNEKCPICSMPLAKRKKGEVADVALPPGVVSRVQLTPYRIVLAGVRTTEVEYRPLVKEISTVGSIEFDERGLKQVAARVKGRIDKLLVNQTGQTVRQGEPLAELYSPDLVVTVQNLLDAHRAHNSDQERLARERLVLWGIAPDQIDAMLRGGQPVTHVTVRSPINGHVIKKYQIEGRYVEEGTPLYDVADLSTVWIQAQVHEEDLGFLPGDNHALRQGEPLRVTATTRAFPGETFPGTLSFVYPHVDQETRTLSVRFELPNSGHKLRPGMTATVMFHIDPEQMTANHLQVRDGKVLAVPESSVIDTGTRKVVYRQSLPGEFEGVLVELGPKMTGADGATYFPVLKGLKLGEQVVTTGSFLIDAETRLNPAAGSIFLGAGPPSAGGPSAQVRPSTPADPGARAAVARISPKAKSALAKLPLADRALAELQIDCPISGKPLGEMGVPHKLTLKGQTVFVCCPGCDADAEADPDGTLKKVADLKAAKRPGSRP